MAAERCGTAVRLVAFDLDGTLLRGDTICEGIARRLGHLERMREFERLTEIGAMTAAREELAGYYRQVTTAVLQDCLGTLRLAPGLSRACDYCAGTTSRSRSSRSPGRSRSSGSPGDSAPTTGSGRGSRRKA